MSAQVGDVIATAEDRDALPARAVVRSSAGTIAARVDDSSGVCFGVAADFPWSRLALPLTVIYLPGTPPRPERVVKAEALREYAVDLDRGLAEAARAGTVDVRTLRAVGDALRARASNIARGVKVKALWDASIDVAHLTRQRDFSLRTFGPGTRTAGVVAHIRKELTEIEAAPLDLSEWVDVVILALDGAWRTGAEPEQIIAAIKAKQARNEARTWPDWRTADPDGPIEHVRADRIARGDA